MSSRIKPEPNAKPKITRENLKSSLYVFKYIRPYMSYFMIGILCLVIGSLAFMAFPGAAGEMANMAIGKGKYNLGIKVQDFWWIFTIILITQGVLSYFRTVLFAIVSEKGMADLRKDLYDKIISQNLTFYEENRVGELTSRITADVEQLQSAFSITLAEFIRQVVVLISGVIIITVLMPKLTILMLATFPAIVIAAVIFGRYIRKMSKERQEKLAETNSIVEETLQSFTVVKSFANEWYESIRYARSVDDIVKISLKFAKVRGLFFIFIITILFGGIFFILWRGAILVMEGKMEVGDLFSFIIYTGVLGGAIASFGNLYTALSQALGATERVRDILQSDSEVDFKHHDRDELIHLKGDVNFTNVKFAYSSRSDVQVLDGVSLDVKAGQKVALVGQSGSGKSTIIQLLMRFYDIDSGSITIDGKKIEDYNILSLRQNIGMVPQEVILFGGSIRENILYGKPHATESELHTAAEQSNCVEFISKFPDGYNTVIGEKGIKLSGGQRQRIAIARAILKNPSILILDEATSSLDAESERVVQEALERLMQGRTSIIIAHRLSTIKEVDCIYVLDDGKIAEKGNHEELSEMEGGLYQYLARLQFEG